MKALTIIVLIAVGISALAGDMYNAVLNKDMVTMKSLVAANPAAVNERNENQAAPLHAAVYVGSTELVQYLINNKAEACAKTFQGITPLHNAASMGNLEVVKLLVNASLGCVNETNRAGMTPLFSACRTNAEVAAFLIANKADVNVRTKELVTPLHVASLGGRVDCVALLLKSEADVNARDDRGYNAAHFVLSKFKNPYKEVLQVLIDHKIDLNAKGLDGKKPLDLAKSVREPEVVEFLKQNGAK